MIIVVLPVVLVREGKTSLKKFIMNNNDGRARKVLKID